MFSENVAVADIRPFGRVVVQCVSPFQDISAIDDEEVSITKNIEIGNHWDFLIIQKPSTTLDHCKS